MRAVLICRGPHGDLAAEELEVEARRLSAIDVEGYRRRAAGEEPVSYAGLLPCDGVRSMTAATGSDVGRALRGVVGLVFVASGHIDIPIDGDILRLGRGTLVAIDDADLVIEGVEHEPGTQLVRVDLPAPVGRIATLGAAGPTAARTDPPNFGLMYRSSDDLSYFRGLDELFAGPPGSWSAAAPAHGMILSDFVAGSYLDWHPEVTNNLVLVTDGDIELEVSGDGSIEHFRAGDVVLAADITGKGHVDRFPVETSLVVAVLRRPVAGEGSWLPLA